MAKHDTYGRVAMLYTSLRGVRGIRYRVQLPSAFSVTRDGGDQAHYISAYGCFFEKDFEQKISMVEAGIEFLPRGKDPNSGAWSTFLNPAGGTTLRHEKPAFGQRGLRSRDQGLGQRVSFELMLVKPDLGTFSVDGVPFNNGTFRPAVPYNARTRDKPEPVQEAFERGVNARIAIGYNDERPSAVYVRDFAIEITEIYRKDKHGAFNWAAPTPLNRLDETGVAKVELGKITLTYGVPPQSLAPWHEKRFGLTAFGETPAPKRTPW